MKLARLLIAASASLSLLGATAPVRAATVGQPAPDFTLTDIGGKPVKLSDFRGRHVVLEWVNPECPYVQKHYGSGNMQGLQKEAGAKNVAWVMINSTRGGHSEYKSPADMREWIKDMGSTPTAAVLDPDGKVGRAYGARTTPHMYIVDPKGQLVYAGGIDDKRSTRQEDVKTAKNYVRAALGEALAGKPVSAANTPPYGCSIKY